MITKYIDSQRQATMQYRDFRSEKFPICPQSDIVPVVEIGQVPVHCNLLWPSQLEALSAPRGDIDLVYLPDCGHVFNVAFDPELMRYSQAYENSLHFSPRFQQYASMLADNLVKRYGLRGKKIIEIGSGQGDFLRMLCELGDNQGVGFDPSLVPEEKDDDESVTFIQDFYSERYSNYQADFIICRHVLEHIHEPDEFLSTIRNAIGHQLNTIVFFEVPNVLFTLRELSIWDIIYEHYSYFSSHSLAELFLGNGFQVLNIAETFDGQFLTIEAKPADGRSVPVESESDVLDQMIQRVIGFSENYRRKVALWRQDLQYFVETGMRVVVWGAGSKGVSFVNTVGVKEIVQYMVDINPRKEGMFVAGTGQQIVRPEFLRRYGPDIVVIMNPNYEKEIKKQLRALGLTSEIMIA